MSLRIALRPVMACVSFFAVAQAMPAQMKVAVINFQTAVYGTAEIKKADAQMQAKYKTVDTEIAQLSAQLADIQKKVQAGESATLTADQLTSLQSQGGRIQRELQRKQEDRQADVERDTSDIIGATQQKMLEVVKKLAEERGLDLVVEGGPPYAYFFKPAMDITQDATAAYDKAYPATAAAAPAAAPKPAATPKPTAPAKPAGK
jgi:outer membrane protein